MKFKEKAELIILNFLKENKHKGFTVKEIGVFCFSRNIIGMDYYHNVTEFLRDLNDKDMVTWTYNGNVVKRRSVNSKVTGGTYQYLQGEGIDSSKGILELWKDETINYLDSHARHAWKITDLARELCGNVEFITSQTIVMRELESQHRVQFYHRGTATVKGKQSLNGTWVSVKQNFFPSMNRR